jgi:hypothetical protein
MYNTLILNQIGTWATQEEIHIFFIVFHIEHVFFGKTKAINCGF